MLARSMMAANRCETPDLNMTEVSGSCIVCFSNHASRGAFDQENPVQHAYIGYPCIKRSCRYNRHQRCHRYSRHLQCQFQRALPVTLVAGASIGRSGGTVALQS